MFNTIGFGASAVNTVAFGAKKGRGYLRKAEQQQAAEATAKQIELKEALFKLKVNDWVCFHTSEDNSQGYTDLGRVREVTDTTITADPIGYSYDWGSRKIYAHVFDRTTGNQISGPGRGQREEAYTITPSKN